VTPTQVLDEDEFVRRLLAAFPGTREVISS